MPVSVDETPIPDTSGSEESIVWSDKKVERNRKKKYERHEIQKKRERFNTDAFGGNGRSMSSLDSRSVPGSSAKSV